MLNENVIKFETSDYKEAVASILNKHGLGTYRFLYRDPESMVMKVKTVMAYPKKGGLAGIKEFEPENVVQNGAVVKVVDQMKQTKGGWGINPMGFRPTGVGHMGFRAMGVGHMTYPINPFYLVSSPMFVKRNKKTETRKAATDIKVDFKHGVQKTNNEFKKLAIEAFEEVLKEEGYNDIKYKAVADETVATVVTATGGTEYHYTCTIHYEYTIFSDNKGSTEVASNKGAVESMIINKLKLKIT